MREVQCGNKYYLGETIVCCPKMTFEYRWVFTHAIFLFILVRGWPWTSFLCDQWSIPFPCQPNSLLLSMLWKWRMLMNKFLLCLSICIMVIDIYYLSPCRNPSLLNDFVNLPKKRGNGTRPKNWKKFHKFAENGNHFISVIDRLDHGVESNIMLPQKHECGDGMQYVNRVFGGDFTSISEFPWYIYLNFLQ